MNCPNCGHELRTLIRCLSPVEQRDDVRVLGEDEEGGIAGEFTGGIEIRQSDGTQSWLECPHCGAEIEGGDADRLEIAVAEPPADEDMPLDGSARARGRNGWFKPAQARVARSDNEGMVTLTVRSARMYGDLPPILLALGTGDALSLARTLEHQALALRTASDSPSPP